jgi:hypothetical protein
MQVLKSYSSIRPVSTVWFVREQTPEEIAAAAAADAAKVAAAKAAFDAEVAKKVEAEVLGLKNKNTELLTKNKTLSELAKNFEGVNLDELKALKASIDANEDAKLIAEGKGAQVIEKYTTRMRAQHEAEIAAEREKIKAETARADQYKGAVLDNQIREVLVGLHKGAVDDAIMHARTQFVLDAKGKAVQLDASGNPVLGKDGSTPFSPAEWIEMQKELKPHWFPASSSGSGAGGGDKGGSGAGKTISRANFDKLSGTEQGTLARSGVKITD